MVSAASRALAERNTNGRADLGKTIIFISETNESPSRNKQLETLAEPGATVIHAGRLSPNEIERRMRKKNDALVRGDRIKIYDLTCFNLTTNNAIRLIQHWRRRGIEVELPGLGLVFAPGEATDKHETLIEALDQHWRMIHGQKTKAATKKPVGRKPRLMPHQYQDIVKLLAEPGATPSSVSQHLGVARATLYEFLKRNKTVNGD